MRTIISTVHSTPAGRVRQVDRVCLFLVFFWGGGGIFFHGSILATEILLHQAAKWKILSQTQKISELQTEIDPAAFWTPVRRSNYPLGIWFCFLRNFLYLKKQTKTVINTKLQFTFNWINRTLLYLFFNRRREISETTKNLGNDDFSDEPSKVPFDKR